MKPTNGNHQPATQVKVLSPEIFNVRKADSFHMLEGETLICALVSRSLLSRGLSPWDDDEWKLQELGRSMRFPRWGYRQTSINSQDVEKSVWKSDHSILVMKQGNACGAKGMTLLCRGEKRHKPTPELEALWNRN